MKNPLPGQLLRDARGFWEILRRGDFRSLFAAGSQNSLVQLFRYGLTGGTSFLVDFLLLFLLERAGVYYLPAAAVAFTVGITCNFLLTKFFAFRSIAPSVKGAGEVAVFAAISGVGLGLTMLLMYFFTSRLHLYFMLSKLISSVTVFLWNFLGRKLILYPGKKNEG